jgi:hypothetical protein
MAYVNYSSSAPQGTVIERLVAALVLPVLPPLTSSAA